MTKTLSLLPRDVQILQFVSKFGYCQEKHVQHLCNLTEAYTLKVIKRIVEAGLIERNRILAYQNAYLWLTKEGARFVGCGVSTSRPVLNTLNHDMLLIDLYFKLFHSSLSIIKTDKEIRRELGIIERNETLRIPDLLVDGTIAIELELSEKPVMRLVHIINTYLINNDITEVHYYLISEKLLKKIKTLTHMSSKFKFFLLKLENDGIKEIIPFEGEQNNFDASSLNLNHVKPPKKFGSYTYLP